MSKDTLVRYITTKDYLADKIDHTYCSVLDLVVGSLLFKSVGEDKKAEYFYSRAENHPEFDSQIADLQKSMHKSYKKFKKEHSSTNSEYTKIQEQLTANQRAFDNPNHDQNFREDKAKQTLAEPKDFEDATENIKKTEQDIKKNPGKYPKAFKPKKLLAAALKQDAEQMNKEVSRLLSSSE